MPPIVPTLPATREMGLPDACTDEPAADKFVTGHALAQIARSGKAAK